MDALTRAISDRADIRIAYVDVSDVASDLAARHLAGPVAGRALGHGLAAVSFLSVLLKRQDHAVHIQLGTDGPIGGVSAEVWGDNQLRGYTNVKLFADLDGRADVDLAEVFGAKGLFTVTHSSPTELMYQGVVHPQPPTVRTGLAKYYHESMQTPAAVELWSSGVENVDRVVGVMAEKLPGGDTEAFVKVLEAFNGGAIREALANGADLPELGRLMGLDDLRELATTPLRFGCRCSQPKVLGVLASLPTEELREIAAAGEPQDVTCHFCGNTYRIPAIEVGKLADQLEQ